MSGTTTSAANANGTWTATNLLLAAALALPSTGCGRDSRPGEPFHDAGDTAGGTDTGTVVDPGPGWGSMPGYRMSWAVQAGGPFYFGPSGENQGDMTGDWARSISLAPGGDVFFAGRVSTYEVFFGLGTENEIAFDVNVRGGVYLARYHGSGVPVWVASPGPRSASVDRVVGLDGGDAVIAGRINHEPGYPTTFGAGEPGEVVVDVSCYECPFLARYHGDGTLVWAIVGDGFQGGIKGLDLATDGDLCVSGEYKEWMRFDDGTTGGITVANEGRNGFAGRFGPDGKARWVVAMNDDLQGPRGVSSATALPDGSCAFGLTYDDYAIVHGWDGDSVQVQAAPESDGGALVARYDPQGNLEWVSDLHIASLNGGYGGNFMTLAAVGDDVAVSGSFNGSIRVGSGDDEELVSSGPSERDMGIFVSRLRGQDGQRLWTAVALGGNGNDTTFTVDDSYAAAALPDGGILVGGCFTGRKVFGAGEEHETELIALGFDCNAFLAAFEGDGSLRWASRVVASADWNSTALPWGEVVFGVAVTEAGSIFAAGQFQSVAAFGTGPEDAMELWSMGSYDAFLLRLDPEGLIPDVP